MTFYFAEYQNYGPLGLVFWLAFYQCLPVQPHPELQGRFCLEGLQCVL